MNANLDIFYDTNWKEVTRKDVVVNAYYTPISSVLVGIKVYLDGVELFDYDGSCMCFISNQEVHPLDYNYICECFSNLLNASVMDVQQKCLIYVIE